jgi:hypothetical protein
LDYLLEKETTRCGAALDTDEDEVADSLSESDSVSA